MLPDIINLQVAEKSEGSKRFGLPATDAPVAGTTFEVQAGREVGGEVGEDGGEEKS
jgi:hypothetical protein